jgi:hypothetical protein
VLERVTRGVAAGLGACPLGWPDSPTRRIDVDDRDPDPGRIGSPRTFATFGGRAPEREREVAGDVFVLPDAGVGRPQVHVAGGGVS